MVKRNLIYQDMHRGIYEFSQLQGNICNIFFFFFFTNN